MTYYKYTTGYVIQTFNNDGTPTSQTFIAGDEVEYEDIQGQPLSAPIEGHETTFPFNMVQPKG